MVVNFLFFTIKIERNKAAQRMAEYNCERYLQERADAQAMQAAQYPDFAIRG
jgi:hypothetical protein